jgi:hypothetical protein
MTGAYSFICSYSSTDAVFAFESGRMAVARWLGGHGAHGLQNGSAITMLP